MKVLKFGGSSLATAPRIDNACQIIKSARDQGSIVVVVSALGGVTDKLIEAARIAVSGHKKYREIVQGIKTRHLETLGELLEDPQSIQAEIEPLFDELGDLLKGVFLVRYLAPKTMDQILSFGERLSAVIVSAGLVKNGVKAAWLDARRIIRTDSNYSSARVDLQATLANIDEYFKSASTVQVVTGFIAANAIGDTTTLGRSGSDYTASLVGAGVQAEEIQIWTDVDGVMTTDPRKEPDAFTLSHITYEEALEMSHFGAEVIFPPATQPARIRNIPLVIKNTFKPEFAGTVISNEARRNGFVITGISSIRDIALVRIQGSGMIGVAGINARIFQALASRDISVFLVSLASSEHSICMAIYPADAEAAQEVLEEEFEVELLAQVIDQVKIETDLSVVAVVGENMRHRPRISGRVFSALGRQNINVVAIAQGSSERNISIVVTQADETAAIKTLHRTFFKPEEKLLDIYLVGTGLIGSELLHQIAGLENPPATIRLLGVANIDKMLLSPAGIELTGWQDELNKNGDPTDLETFFEKIPSYGAGQAILVDCTATKTTAEQYEKLLQRGVSVVTPNKVANTLGYDYFQSLKTAGGEKAHFYYETNVGAGLPVISTLRGLQDSGDTILKIEAVLSGTLSYLFNAFDGSVPFSTLVKEALGKGYTEPDPRNDLNGLDVARKILILARELGFPMELNNVEVESLLPAGIDPDLTVPQFITALADFDAQFEEQRKAARDQRKFLRYLAVLEGGKATVKLTGTDQTHPAATLIGSENVIVLTTARYCDYPLTIKGPGAGAPVTAAGILTDIFKCVQTEGLL